MFSLYGMSTPTSQTKKVLDASLIEHRMDEVAFWVGNFVEKDVDIRMEQQQKLTKKVYKYSKACFKNSTKSIAGIPNKVVEMLQIDVLRAEVDTYKAKTDLLMEKLNEIQTELEALREEREERVDRRREREDEADPNERSGTRLRTD